MIVLGANSDISQAFVEKALQKGEQYATIYLLSSDTEKAGRFAKHIQARYNQASQTIAFDLTKDSDYSFIDHLESNIVFCASGYLGESSATALYNDDNSNKIIEINYSKLVILLNHFAKKFEQNGSGTIIALSSVAGERGRQSNFMYGSAKAGFTAYLQGLRNYLFHKGVHVLTVIPGFMNTQMTANIKTPAPLTASPQKAAGIIYNAYKRKKNVVYVSFIWRLIMLVIKSIPEFIFKKLKM